MSRAVGDSRGARGDSGDNSGQDGGGGEIRRNRGEGRSSSRSSNLGGRGRTDCVRRGSGLGGGRAGLDLGRRRFLLVGGRSRLNLGGRRRFNLGGRGRLSLGGGRPDSGAAAGNAGLDVGRGAGSHDRSRSRVGLRAGCRRRVSSRVSGSSLGMAGSGGGSLNLAGRGGCVSAVGLGAAGAATAERDGRDSERAGLLGSVGLRRVDDGHVLGTTALGVLDNATGRGASRSVLASGAIGHVVVELQIAVEFGVDVEFTDTSLVDAGGGIAAKGGRGTLGAGGASGNALAGDLGASTKHIPLAETSLASESRPEETTIATDLTISEVRKVQTLGLLIGTLIIGVAGAGERSSVEELSRR
jgi:hypothetical protein